MLVLHNKEVFIAYDGKLPQKNKVFILTEGGSKVEFLVTEVGRLTWARNEETEGLLVEITGVYGDTI